MKIIKNICLSILVLCTILFVAGLLGNSEPSGFPQQGTCADKAVFWTARAEIFRNSANAQFANDKESFGRIDLATANDCLAKAEHFRNLHNRELGVHLWRSLATIGSTPEASEYFWKEYEMRKL